MAKYSINEVILIVDDDFQLQQLLITYLSEQGYSVSAVGDGAEMDLWLKKFHAELIILDLMLPGEDGLSLARRIRHDSSTPIIMLSARGEEMDKIIGLEVGADDYLAKPFNPRELLARIRAVLRRGVISNTELIDKSVVTEKKYQAGNQRHNNVEFDDFILNIESQVLWKNGEQIELTSGEMGLLIIFVTHPNRVLNREKLMNLMSDGDSDPFDRSVDVRITRLRRKLGDSISKPKFIRTVWGEGYRFTPGFNPAD